jgi:hypothetical protein
MELLKPLGAHWFQSARAGGTSPPKAKPHTSSTVTANANSFPRRLARRPVHKLIAANRIDRPATRQVNSWFRAVAGSTRYSLSQKRETRQ